jgi:putative MATE family efflux protein
MNNKRENMLATMNIKSLLIKLSIPATLGMMVNALYNLVDAYFVSKGAGEIALGALTLAFPVQIIVTAVGIMIGVGAASAFSRAFGRQDKETMTRSVNTALGLDVIIALIISVLGSIYIDDLLKLFAATDENVGYARDYLSVILIGLVPLSLTIVMNNLARAEGRPRIAMYTMAIGAGLNILLDPFFIFDFGLGLGVTGAALATVTSQTVAFFYALYHALSKKSSLMVDLKKWFVFKFDISFEILSVGFPSFIRSAIGAVLSVVILNMISTFAAENAAIYTSIYGVINRTMAFVFMPGFGIVQGLHPIAGFSYGAKNYGRLRSSVIFATKLMAIYFFLGFLFIQFFSGYVFQAFSDPQVDSTVFITYGTRSFKTISWGFTLLGFQIMLSALYQALGYPIRALVVATSRQLWIFLPIALILTSQFELDGIWMTFAVSDLLAGALSLVLLIFELRKFKRLETKESILRTDPAYGHAQ